MNWQIIVLIVSGVSERIKRIIWPKLLFEHISEMGLAPPVPTRTGAPLGSALPPLFGNTRGITEPFASLTGG